MTIKMESTYGFCIILSFVLTLLVACREWYPPRRIIVGSSLKRFTEDFWITSNHPWHTWRVTIKTDACNKCYWLWYAWQIPKSGQVCQTRHHLLSTFRAVVDMSHEWPMALCKSMLVSRLLTMTARWVTIIQTWCSFLQIRTCFSAWLPMDHCEQAVYFTVGWRFECGF